MKLVTPNLKDDHVIQWKISVIDYNNVESKFRVTGFTTGLVGEIELLSYVVTVKQSALITNTYIISLFSDKNNKLTFINRYEVAVPTFNLAVVYENQRKAWPYLTLTTFK